MLSDGEEMETYDLAEVARNLNESIGKLVLPTSSNNWQGQTKVTVIYRLLRLSIWMDSV